MAEKNGFKVVIAGAGIAGLTLANMLEKMGLDYVVLEKHSAVAPAVGASIGLFPNGLRVLDQLGLYKAIEDQFEGQALMEKSHTRRPDGTIISTTRRMDVHLVRRYGYGMYFFDRQKLLQILYDKLQHKERVLVSKGVTDVELTTDGVIVTCADGSVFSGTLLVGADGIHSAVRAIMKSLAAKLEPGYFDPAEEDSVPCFYRCNFGIAQNVPGWVAGEQHMVTGRDGSQLVVSGPENKVYWFLFDKLPETKYGKEIPKFTSTDEIDFAKKNYSRPVTEKLTWGQIYDCKISSTLTPLHEVVFKKWFFRRIITIGDSAHKPNPLGGQGGNGAIESCAELCNALMSAKDRAGGSLSSLTTEDVVKAFSETQRARHGRAELVVQRSHETQALFAYEKPWLSAFLVNCIMPNGGAESTLNHLAYIFPGGATIRSLPVPRRPRLVPYEDELPSRPVAGQMVTLARGALVVSMGAAVLLTTKVWRLPLDEIRAAKHYGLHRIHWFGNTGATDVLEKMITGMALHVREGDVMAKLHGVYFLTQLISPLLVYGVEGHRIGNRGTPLSLPSFFSVAMQIHGIGRIAPLHAVLSAFATPESPTGRPVPVEVTKSLVPALTIGFVLPTALLFLPTPNVRAWQYIAAWWQFGPPLFNLLTNIFSSGLRWWESRGRHSKDKEEEKDELLDSYQNRDVPALKSAYAYAFAVQATTHLASLAYGGLHPGVSLWSTFFALPNPFASAWNLASVGNAMFVFLKYDMVVAVSGYVASNLYSVWNLRRLGYIKTHDAIKATAGIVAGQVLVGPGATWAGLWYWRESVLSSFS
ncbi:hypothetical protein S40285_00759 [Stachybotrys chlorohalonatus IBT 40285]|uniref:FAD-binding domain-containing protein n=1 Tax=Stachybotrys chlorohalonatus (strain IBT 40285) TaxID=1283841 RepID=A0A084QRB7_STAC4|nr:hypothetical protein S40285_00759 [Stachybotrys chlorohalonata IBT 40285]